MTGDNLISIIVPFYKVPEFADKCIQSIISQTYGNLEIILVDDGSPDNCGEICEKYAAQDSRVKVIHKKNGGLSEARNFGLDIAKGDYIGFVDGDDWCHPQMYELLLAKLKEADADLAICNYQSDNPDFDKNKYDKDKVSAVILTGTEAMEKPHRRVSVCAWDKLYKAEFFKDIRYPVGKYYEDAYIFHHLYSFCQKVAVLSYDCPLYFYTVRPGSITNCGVSLKHIDDFLGYMDLRFSYAASHDLLPFIAYDFSDYCEYCMDNYYAIKKHPENLHPSVAENADNIAERLWRSERDTLAKYNLLKRNKKIFVDEKYRAFAKSPQYFEKWQENLDKRVARRKVRKEWLRKIKSLVKGLFS